MSRETVISREYKMMLRAHPFAGDEPQFLTTADRFSEDLTHLIRDIALDVDGDLGEVDQRRLVTLYDTPQRLLQRNHYIFRARDDLMSGAREVTFTCRHPDRYTVQDRTMEVRKNRTETHRGKASHVTTKFEEDIKPPFGSFYSFSTTHPIPRGQLFQRLRDVAVLYKDLDETLDQDSGHEAITVVGSPVREVVIKGTKFQLGKTPCREAECALILWYRHPSEARQPVIVEFSFRYGDPHEHYTRRMTQRAYYLFQRLQTKLTRWVDPKAETKTAYMYQ